MFCRKNALQMNEANCDCMACLHTMALVCILFLCIFHTIVCKHTQSHTHNVIILCSNLSAAHKCSHLLLIVNIPCI